MCMIGVVKVVKFVAAAFAGVFLAALFAAPVGAVEPAPDRSEFKLTVSRAGGGATVSRDRSVVLKCDPPRGSHPKKTKACQELEARGGRLAAQDPGDVLCTMEYDPVTVTAVGSWRGQAVQFKETYVNNCLMLVHTGVVFQF
jgi:hypothetical protein